MTLEKMIAKLNEDLGNEYAHWNFYLSAASNVQGLHREEYREFFLKQAAEEATHVDEFRKVITGLDGIPVNHIRFANYKTDVRELLAEAMKMEYEVVENYVTRIDEAIELQNNGGVDKVHGKYLEIFLEEQVKHSREDADEMKQMLSGSIIN
jgi:bacterioferritin